MATFKNVRDAEALDSVLAQAEAGSAVIFLFDPYCPINYAAREEVEATELEVAEIDVSRERDLSRMVERRTGVRHESPQVIVIERGRVRWHASHMRIRQRDLEAAMAPSGADAE